MAVKPDKKWAEYIKPHISKYDKKTKSIFTSFNLQVKKKKITSTSEMNKLWNDKYKSKIDNVLKQSGVEYKKLWEKYHNS